MDRGRLREKEERERRVEKEGGRREEMGEKRTEREDGVDLESTPPSRNFFPEYGRRSSATHFHFIRVPHSRARAPRGPGSHALRVPRVLVRPSPRAPIFREGVGIPKVYELRLRPS
jgi:hypothetical protein